jgi:phosphoribosyl 1,2-cyclic phosphodiesterase
MEFIVLSSGSKGNCSALKIGEQIILVDCGLRFAQLQQAFKNHKLEINKISHVIITHEHADHILGLKVLNNNLPSAKILLTKGTFIAYTEKTKHIMSNHEFVCPHNILDINGYEFDFFPTMHDARESIGFTITHNNKKFSYLTDCGNINQHIINKVSGTTHFALEANYCPELLANGKYPEFLKQRVAGNYGHLSNYQTSNLLQKIKDDLQHVCLMHLSENNNNPTVAFNVCKKALNETTVLDVASQNNGAKPFIID